VNSAECWYILKDANPFYLALTLLIFISTVFNNVWRWNILLEVHQIVLGYWKVLRLYLVGMFFNTFMLGTTGGDLIKMYYVAKQTKQGVIAGTTIILDRLAGLFSLTLLAFTALLLRIDDPRLRGLLGPVALFLFAFITATLFFLWATKHPKAQQWVRKLLARIRMQDFYDKIQSALADYASHPRVFISVIGISLMIHISIVITNALAGHALGITGVSLASYCAIVPVILFLSSIPISIAGWGIAEALYISFFGAFGVSPVEAVTLSILIKFFYYLLGLLSVVAYITPGLDRVPKHISKDNIL
jgi:uncharacterized protein (TIRG00374 family)